MTDYQEISERDQERLKILEALLFAAPGLCGLDQLAQVLEIPKAEVERLLSLLGEQLSSTRGIRLQRVKNQYQLISAPEYGDYLENFLGLEVSSRLSQQALEVLAIIAYKQPTTRPEIDSIRGVNSDSVVKSLLSKGLIEELGRSELAGRPFLYGVTPEFLLNFGLESLEDLPEINLDSLLASKSSQENSEYRILKD